MPCSSMVEQVAVNDKVVGSSPTGAVNNNKTRAIQVLIAHALLNVGDNMERTHKCRRLNECQCVVWILKIIDRHVVSNILMDHLDCDREWADQMAGLHDDSWSLKADLTTSVFIRVCESSTAQDIVRALQEAGCEARCGCTCEIKV